MCAFQVMHGSCKDFPSAPDKGAHAPPAIDQTATFVVVAASSTSTWLLPTRDGAVVGFAPQL